MEYSLIATKEVDHGAGPPYDPCMQTHVIMRASERVHGKQFFTAIDSSWTWSKTWLSDEKVAEWLGDGSWTLTNENSALPISNER